MLAPIRQPACGEGDGSGIVVERDDFRASRENGRCVTAAPERAIQNRATASRRETREHLRQQHRVVVFVARRFHRALGYGGERTHT